MQNERAAGPETRPTPDGRKDSDRASQWPLRSYLEAAPPDTPVEEVVRAHADGDDPRDLWGDSP